MNLPHPFQDAVGIRTNTDGTISLIDPQGKTLTQVPLSTAFELSTGAEGHGVQDYNDLDGSGFGDIDARGSSMKSIPIGCRITCKDGFSVSIQASARHYCRPRTDEGPWTHVELGFPNQCDPMIEPYAEDADDPLHTVYPCVPIDLVERLVESHGGIA
jgi:hypothetical protein